MMNPASLRENTKRPVLLITGSSGLLGSALIQRFANTYQIFALDLKPSDTPLPDGVQFLKIDLTSAASIQECFQEIADRGGQRIASVIHLAAYYDFSGAESDMYEKVTVRGTERLLMALQHLDVEQFVFTSTLLVHAPRTKGQRINEDWTIAPKWPYPESKVRTEEIIQKFRGDIPAVILRIAGVYTDECDSIPLSHQIQRIAEKRFTSHFYPADASNGQPFVHLEDFGSALDAVVARRSDLPQTAIFLIGEDETFGYGEIQDRLGQLLHGEDHWRTGFVPKSLAKAGAWIQDHFPGVEDPFIQPWMVEAADDHYELDISRAQKWLDWTPRRSLMETIPKMIEAYRRDPRGWYQKHHLSGAETQKHAAAR